MYRIDRLAHLQMKPSVRARIGSKGLLHLLLRRSLISCENWQDHEVSCHLCARCVDFGRYTLISLDCAASRTERWPRRSPCIRAARRSRKRTAVRSFGCRPGGTRCLHRGRRGYCGLSARRADPAEGPSSLQVIVVVLGDLSSQRRCARGAPRSPRCRRSQTPGAERRSRTPPWRKRDDWVRWLWEALRMMRRLPSSDSITWLFHQAAGIGDILGPELFLRSIREV